MSCINTDSVTKLDSKKTKTKTDLQSYLQGQRVGMQRTMDYVLQKCNQYPYTFQMQEKVYKCFPANDEDQI